MKPKKKAKGKKPKTAGKTPAKAPSEEELTCSHCAKVLKSVAALKYHVDNLVCRKDKRKKPPLEKNDAPAGEQPRKKQKRVQRARGKSKTNSSTNIDTGNEKLSTDSNQQTKPKRKRKSVHRNLKEDSTDEEESLSALPKDDDDDSDFAEDPAAKGDSKGNDSELEDFVADEDSPEETIPCPHCQKPLKSKQALKYHLNSFVCRPALRPSFVPRPKKKRKKKQPEGGRQRNRGTKEKRTCPHCGKVFTSDLGLKYHIDRKVCTAQKKQAGQEQSTSTAWPTLEPGQRFVTKYGVVEVVKDDRVVPTVPLPEDIRSLTRSFTQMRGTWEKRGLRAFAKVAAHIRARRFRINALYEENNRLNLTTQGNFEVYFGGNPAHVERPSLPAAREPLEDPSRPTMSFPDRIVECRWIPDERARRLGLKSKEPAPQTSDQLAGTSSKMFLRRCELTEHYHAHCATFECLECGKRHPSRPSLHYHVTQEGCKVQAGKRKSFLKAKEEMIAANTDSIMKEYSRMKKKVIPTAVQQKNQKAKKRRKAMSKELSMYPETLLSLDFLLVKKDNRNNLKPTVIEKPTYEAPPLEKPKDDHPKDVLQKLKQTLAREMRAFDDARYGSMYQELFKSLGYKKPRKRRTKTKPFKKGSVGQQSTLPVPPAILPPVVEPKVGVSFSYLKRRNRTVKAAPQPKESPPTIDTLALAHEIDSGRYPSMNRYTEDDHGDTCIQCKLGNGLMLCCDFCKNVEHLDCFRQKFTIKAPEPEDDFICHRCIQTILSRRKRAEKRRRNKQEQQQKQIEDEQVNQPKMKAGKEYEFLADRGQEVNTLLQLLQNSKGRLRAAMATARMNAVRRRTMEEG